MSKQDPYMLDTNTDCGMPAALTIMIWITGLSCILATVIAIAAVAALAGVGR